MQLRSTIHALLTIALGAAACSEERERPDGGVVTRVDTGVPPDAGEPPDSGEPPDLGTMDAGPCNPVDGTGCADPQACVFVSNINVAQCRNIAAAPKAHEAACSNTLHDCDVGFTCIDLGMGLTCHKTCDSNMGGVGCAGLTGSSPSYACVPLRSNTGQSLLYGVCAGRGNTCVPYADQCGAGKVCSLVSMNPSCEDAGAVPVGGDCTNDNCARGGICIFLNGTPNPTCYEPCNPQNPQLPACPQGTQCAGLQGQSFGVCD